MTGQIWQLYALYASMAILGAGAGAVTWTFLIAERFEKNRGLALGIALSGTGVASMVMPWVATIGVELSDWRSGYLGVAAFCLLVILPLCAIVLRNYRPSQHAVKSVCFFYQGFRAPAKCTAIQPGSIFVLPGYLHICHIKAFGRQSRACPTTG